MAEYGVGYHHDDSGGAAMLRPIFIAQSIFVATVLIAVLPSAPSFAVSAKEKMATCKFGADDQKLAGAARAKFMKNCMANKNDPRGGAGAAGPGGAGGVPPPPKN
jgi:psiF repeat